MAQAIPTTAAPASAPKTIRLGKVTLDKCGSSPLTYCGGMTVPLDYASKASPGIHIGFLWVPAAKRNHPKGTVLAVEGGPGFMTFGSEFELPRHARPAPPEQEPAAGQPARHR